MAVRSSLAGLAQCHRAQVAEVEDGAVEEVADEADEDEPEPVDAVACGEAGKRCGPMPSRRRCTQRCAYRGDRLAEVELDEEADRAEVALRRPIWAVDGTATRSGALHPIALPHSGARSKGTVWRRLCWRATTYGQRFYTGEPKLPVGEKTRSSPAAPSCCSPRMACGL